MRNRLERVAERERREIEQRSFEFATAVVRLVQSLPPEVPRHLIDQVVVLGTAIGAQIDEAQRSVSRRRHLSEMSGARRDCGRLVYWLRLLSATGAAPAETTETFIGEANHLCGVLTDICLQARQHLPESEPNED